MSPVDEVLDQYLQSTTALSSDCFDSFIHGPIVKVNEGTDVYSWPKDNCCLSVPEQALDLLSIPAMSAGASLQ